MKKLSFISLLFAFSCVILLFESCKKEDDILNNNGDLQLSFSADTVFFDTVFTTVGTITKIFKVYNNSNSEITISSAEIPSRQASNFRINVDGRSGVNITDIKLKPKDSLWVFVQATIDPNNTTTPMIVEDSIIFTVNNKPQQVRLVAFGQDAYFHYPKVAETNTFPAYSTISGTLPTDKPHVIYGWVFVPNDSLLIIPANTRIYMHHNANIAVLSGASLKIQGELNNEVVISGDRLDSYYKDQAGAWGRIWLSAGSLENEIDYAIIQNGRIGIHVDTLGNSTAPTLIMKNTIIKNMSVAGLFAQGSWVEAENCVFANCGEMTVWLNIGGKYSFKHCTFGNYWTATTRKNPSLIINNYYKDMYGNYQVRGIESAYFGNCIIYGNRNDEFFLDKYPYGTSQYNIIFDHCLIRSELNFADEPATFSSCLKNQSPLFENTDSVYFNLRQTSPAIDAGSSSIASGIFQDIEGNTREQGMAPDLGAYEVR